jgi:hypothetical protein
LKISQSTTRTNGVKQFTSGTPLPDTQTKKKKKKKKKTKHNVLKETEQRANSDMPKQLPNRTQAQMATDTHLWCRDINCGAL